MSLRIEDSFLFSYKVRREDDFKVFNTENPREFVNGPGTFILKFSLYSYPSFLSISQ